MAGRREFFCPYIRKGGTTEMTASGFPTRGRAHPSVRGGSLFRSCREKNCSPYRTSQKAHHQHGRGLSTVKSVSSTAISISRYSERSSGEIKSLMREESGLWANRPVKPRRLPASVLHR